MRDGEIIGALSNLADQGGCLVFDDRTSLTDFDGGRATLFLARASTADRIRSINFNPESKKVTAFCSAPGEPVVADVLAALKKRQRDPAIYDTGGWVENKLQSLLQVSPIRERLRVVEEEGGAFVFPPLIAFSVVLVAGYGIARFASGDRKWGALVVLLVVGLASVVFSIGMHGAYVNGEDDCEVSDLGFEAIERCDFENADFKYRIIYNAPTVVFLIAAAACVGRGEKHVFAFLATWLTVLNFRQAVFQLTAVPPPAELRQQLGAISFLQEFFSDVPTDSIKSNFDMLFSGHTSTLAISLYFLFGRSESLLILASLALYSVLLVSIRLHYSIDCFLAIVISLSVLFQADRFLNSSAQPFARSRLFHLLALSVVLGFAALFLSAAD